MAKAPVESGRKSMNIKRGARIGNGSGLVLAGETLEGRNPRSVPRGKPRGGAGVEQTVEVV
jgi:hypothetical protein